MKGICFSPDFGYGGDKISYDNTIPKKEKGDSTSTDLTRLYRRDAISNTLNNSSTFMSKNTREFPLRIMSIKCIGISMTNSGVQNLKFESTFTTKK